MMCCMNIVSCVQADSTYCLVQTFQQLQSFGGAPLLNEYDCPRLDLTTAIFSTPGKNIKRAVSIVHDCDTSCCFKRTETVEYFERQETVQSKLVFEHDWCNTSSCALKI
eukprot:Em0012g477a